MNQLISIAAWICAIATVIYQRLIIPAIHRYTPELLQLFETQLTLALATDPPAPIQLQQQGETIPITRKRRRKTTSAYDKQLEKYLH